MWRNGLPLGIFLSLLTAAQLLSSFGIQLYTVARLGAGPDTDALYAGATLLQVLLAVVMEPLSCVLVPLLSARQEHERRQLAWPLFLEISLLSVVVTMMLYGSAPYLVSALVPGFSEATRQLTVDLARIQLMGFVGVASFTVLSALYASRSQFVWTAIAVLLCSLLGWVVLVTGLSQIGVKLAAWVQVLVCSGPAVLLLKALGTASRASLPATSSGLSRELWSHMRPLLLSAAYVRTGFVVDRFLTSFLAPGSLVMLELTWRVLAAVVRVFNQGVVTPIVPTLAKLARARAWREFVQLCRTRMLWMAGMSVIALGGLLMMTIVGQYIGLWAGGQSGPGALTPDMVSTLRFTALACMGALLCGGLNHLLVNAFYAEGEMGVPAKVEAMTSTGGLILKVLGFYMGGLIGIAVAISVQYALTSLLLGSALYRRMMARLREGLPASVGGLVAAGPSERTL